MLFQVESECLTGCLEDQLNPDGEISTEAWKTEEGRGGVGTESSGPASQEGWPPQYTAAHTQTTGRGAKPHPAPSVSGLTWAMAERPVQVAGGRPPGFHTSSGGPLASGTYHAADKQGSL